MSPDDDIRKLLSGARGKERDELEQVIERLQQEAPYPGAGFRSKLRQMIAVKTRGQRRVEMRPTRLRALIGAYSGSGFALLLVAAIGLAGVGPFAA